MAKGGFNGHALITPEYMHYTVHKDSANPGQGDGFGGAEFRIELLLSTAYWDLEKLGFRVKILGDALDAGTDRYILETQNLWQQGTIPERHRHLFTPNCRIL